MQYFHIALSALLSALLAFCFKKIVRDLVSHSGPPYDRYDWDVDIIYILYHYFYTRFSGETPDVLALNTSFFFFAFSICVSA